MTRARLAIGAALSKLRVISSLVDLRDVHFYGGLLMVYLGARALSPHVALALVGLVLMITGLVYRGPR